jgi:hypothetical protein
MNWKWYGRKQSPTNLKKKLPHFPGKSEEILRNLDQNSRCPGRDLNCGLPHTNLLRDDVYIHFSSRFNASLCPQNFLYELRHIIYTIINMFPCNMSCDFLNAWLLLTSQRAVFKTTILLQRSIYLTSKIYCSILRITFHWYINPPRQG